MRRFVAAGVVGVLLSAGAAWAYDPATTHAGLTEKAVLASALHKVLSRRMGRALGVLEPLQIHSRYLEPGPRRALWARLEALDPSGGYRPDTEGSSTALSWVVAGSVLAETPPERGRHHFFDPLTKKGLDDRPGLAGFVHEVRLAFDDGATLREIATGEGFDLTGYSSLEWINAPYNDLGLPALLMHWEKSATAADPAERESALVRALLALGGIMAVLEDAGEPAHVRNDFRHAYLDPQGRSSWDRGSAYERYVAGRFGRTGVPAPKAAIARPNLESFFTGTDGQGLADRTQRRFFSPGTVPDDSIADPRTTPAEVIRAARESLVYPQPTIPHLSLKDPRPHYVLVEGRRALAYVRLPGHVHFFLDNAVYADTASAALPETAGYAAGLLDHVLRAGIQATASGRQVTLTLEGTTSGPSEGTLKIFGEDDRGNRRELAGVGPGSLSPGQPVTITAPAGVRKLAAVMRGKDSAGAFVAVGETSVD
jgi:hypothetical protein